MCADRTTNPPRRSGFPETGLSRTARSVYQPYLMLVMLGVTGMSHGSSAAGPAAEPHNPYREAEHSGWSFYLDNDRLSLTESDFGYTAGFALSRSGRASIRAPLSLHKPLRGLSRWLGWTPEQTASPRHRFHSVSYGMAAFTPEAIESEAPIYGERPYACLAYTASTQQIVDPARRSALSNTLSAGLLGTDLCKGVQNLIHEIADGIQARGWGNQISHGGEPTVLWRVSRKRLLHRGSGATRHEVDWSADAQLGWATDAGVGISWRWGMIRSPWWAFTPQQSEYTPVAAALLPRYQNGALSGGEEMYLWAGAMVRYRLHNSLLQGQFRDSKVEISADDINSWLAEIWFGLTQRVSPGLEISLSIRARNRELDLPGNEPLLWGRLALRKSY